MTCENPSAYWCGFSYVAVSRTSGRVEHRDVRLHPGPQHPAIASARAGPPGTPTSSAPRPRASAPSSRARRRRARARTSRSCADADWRGRRPAPRRPTRSSSPGGAGCAPGPRSLIAWKMPWQPPCSTSHIVDFGGVLDRRLEAARAREIRERLAGERRVEAAARELHVLRIAAAALVADHRGDARPSPSRARRRILQPRQRAPARPPSSAHAGQQRRRDARARRGVRILIDRHVDAARARLVDEPQHLDALAPVRLRRSTLCVADLRRQIAPSRRSRSSRSRCRAPSPRRRADATRACRRSGRRPCASSITSSVGVNVPGT